MKQRGDEEEKNQRKNITKIREKNRQKAPNTQGCHSC